jgi:hypothetical protein
LQPPLCLLANVQSSQFSLLDSSLTGFLIASDLELLCQAALPPSLGTYSVDPPEKITACRQSTFIELSLKQFHVLTLPFKKIPQISFHPPLLRGCHVGNPSMEHWLMLFDLM